MKQVRSVVKAVKGRLSFLEKRNPAVFVILFFLFITVSLKAEEKQEGKKVKYFSSTSFSFVMTRGNNKNQTFSFDTDQNLHFKKNQVNLRVDIIYAQKENKERSEVYTAQLSYNYRINKGTYLLGLLAGERNRLAGNEFRFAFAAGAGFEILKKKKVFLSSEISAGRTAENFRKISQLKDFKAYISLIWSTKMKYDISPTSRLSQKNMVFLNFKRFKDWRVDSVTSLKASISENFALKASFRLIYENEPVEGFKAADYFFLTSLVIEL